LTLQALLCRQIKWIEMNAKVNMFLGLVISLFATVVIAQNSSIKGKIIDEKTGEALPGASILIEGTTIGSNTDFDGNYNIANVKPGTYTLVSKYVSYTDKKITDVKVAEGKSVIINVSLSPASTELTGVEVVSSKITNTETAVIMEMKKSNSIVSAISATQIAKSQDRDAAEVVRRVPGVTIIENRFIMVRGLGDRYNTVWMNDAGAPSSETDKKAFSFDIIPSGLIDRILIYKTPSPELPGDFAGGMVKIYTKSLPEKSELVFNYQLSSRDGSTFRDFNSNVGSNTNYFGNSNYYNLPAGVPNYISKNDANNSSVSKSFSNTWGINTTKAAPDERFNITYSTPIKFEKFRLGSVSNITYSNVNTTYKIHRQNWDSTAQVNDYSDVQSTNLVKVGLLENLSFVSANHRIDFKNLFNQVGRTQTTIRESNFMDGPNERAYMESYEKKTNLSSQLSGKHTTESENTEYTWTLGYSYMQKDMPDLRRIKYTKSRTAPDSMYKASVANIVDPVNGGGRFFSSLNEKIYSFNHNLKQKINIGTYSLELNFGNYFEFKNRVFNARTMGYVIAPGLLAYNLTRLPIGQIFDPANVGIPGGFKMDEITSLSDKYAAQNKQLASYALVNLPIGKRINVVTGARYEYNVQSLQSHVNLDSISPSITTKFLLPSINATYNFKKDTSLIRLAYGKTLNRPEFREWSPFYFYDFEFNAGTYGSLFPTIIYPYGSPLKVAQVYNYDLRYEYYPTHTDFVQVGVFYKKFIDPIQQVVLTGGTDSRSFTFINAESAYSRGIEVDARKNLGFLDNLFKTTELFSNFNIVANASLIQSQLKISNVINAQSTAPLQGQSPYVVNGGVYYQNDSSGTQVSLLYNVFGSRIYLLGTSNYANIGEIRRNTLDLSVSQKIAKHFWLNFSIQNILNPAIWLVQDTNRDGVFKTDGSDKEIMKYKGGSYYSIGIKFKL
jgi:outer membrane receptor protein involved in Fe transport